MISSSSRVSSLSSDDPLIERSQTTSLAQAAPCALFAQAANCAETREVACFSPRQPEPRPRHAVDYLSNELSRLPFPIGRWFASVVLFVLGSK
jgi:hypothetical protein